MGTRKQKKGKGRNRKLKESKGKKRGKEAKKLNTSKDKNEKMASSAHEFDVLMNDGSTQSMSVYKGHPLLVVNGASK